jgi:hypothetical protein
MWFDSIVVLSASKRSDFNNYPRICIVSVVKLLDLCFVHCCWIYVD